MRHVVEADETLCRSTRADLVMGITAFGEATTHEVWYWPMDDKNHEFTGIREAIDWAMNGRKAA